MSGSHQAKTHQGDLGPEAAARKESTAKGEVSQVTLSTIGDLSIAADEAISRVSEAPPTRRWLPLPAFFFVIYLACCWLAVYTLKSAPWIRAFLVPLFPVLIATVAFAWRQRWKFRAQDWRFKLDAWRAALVSLGHEATNAANAIRANLVAFQLANPQVSNSEHLDQIQSGTARIEAAVQASRDPMAWKGSKKKKGDGNPPASEEESPRSSIAT